MCSRDIHRIYAAASEFRSAIENCSYCLGASFATFPSGCCGDTCLLLGAHLVDQEMGVFQYMLGDYRSEKNSSWSSHAWLKCDSLIVDITADQFPEISDSVIVRENSEWHATLNGELQNIADYRLYDSATASILARIHTRITDAIAGKYIGEL